MPVLAAVTAAAALAWVYLAAFHGGFWRMDQRLPPARRGPAAGRGPAPPDGPPEWPVVTAVVPARNEAAVLPVTLPTLLAQDYPGELRVLLVDDESTDGTAPLAARLASAAGPGGGRLRVVAAGPRPPGWAGKVWAMQQGLHAAAGTASAEDDAGAEGGTGDAGAGTAGRAGGPDYVLFTDADISYAPGTLAELVRAAQDGRLGLVSQLALLHTGTRWERLIVPAFVYFFAQLYPFRRVNSPGARTAAAAGGCMLVRWAELTAVGGLAPISGARIDDVALGRLLKRGSARCWLGLATGVRSRREYPALAGLWDMIARSAYTQLRYSPLALAGTLAGLAWIYLLPPAAALAGLAALGAGGGRDVAGLAVAGLAGWAIMTATYIPVLRLYRLSPLRAVGLPVAAALYAAMTLDSARRHWAGRGGEWKGRTIGS